MTTMPPMHYSLFFLGSGPTGFRDYTPPSRPSAAARTLEVA